MYRAKARGGGRPQLYTPGRVRERAGHEIQVESALRRAIPDELVAHYQPVVALDGGRPVARRGARALAAPVARARAAGRVHPRRRGSRDWSWRSGTGCSASRAVRWSGRDDLRVSVNVSGRQISDGSLVASVARALEESGLAPHRLQLELTETVLMDDIDGHVALMCELKELGVIAGARRLRHGLLVAQLPPPLPDRPDQDRPGVRRRAAREPGRSGDRLGGGQLRRSAGHRGRRRGRRDAGARRRTAPPGM